jgi:hypothetical protein
MFAFLNLGVQEIFILLVFGLLAIGALIGVVLVVFLASRSGRAANNASEVEELRDEVEQLRAEAQRSKKGRF